MTGEVNGERIKAAVNSSLAKVLGGVAQAAVLGFVGWMLVEINGLSALPDKVDRLIGWTKSIETNVTALGIASAMQAATLATHTKQFDDITAGRTAAATAAVEAASSPGLEDTHEY